MGTCAIGLLGSPPSELRINNESISIIVQIPFSKKISEQSYKFVV